MKKIFLSMPMRGKTEAEIKEYREIVYEALQDKYYREDNNVFVKLLSEGEGVEIIDTIFTDFNGNRLQFLGKSIMEGLALADAAIFVNDWEKYDGCRCEHFIASQYKIPCFYVIVSGGGKK